MPTYALGDRTPVLPPNNRHWIAPDASVIGDVQLGLDVGVWFGAVLRGDNEPIRIGDGSNIQEHTVIHTDPGAPVTVGRNCTIGHCVIVHGCTIGENSLIGMGSTVLNKARIGRNCLIGANSLITEGKEFGDGLLIMGAPAKPVRELTAEEIAGLGLSAERYVANAARFRDSLRPVG